MLYKIAFMELVQLRIQSSHDLFGTTSIPGFKEKNPVLFYFSVYHISLQKKTAYIYSSNCTVSFTIIIY